MGGDGHTTAPGGFEGEGEYSSAHDVDAACLCLYSSKMLLYKRPRCTVLPVKNQFQGGCCARTKLPSFPCSRSLYGDKTLSQLEISTVVVCLLHT